MRPPLCLRGQPVLRTPVRAPETRFNMEQTGVNNADPESTESLRCLSCVLQPDVALFADLATLLAR
jgi:hypothetical protein